MRSRRVGISAEAGRRDSLWQMHLCGNHPVPEGHRSRHRAFRPSEHVPVRSDDMGKYVCARQDVASHTYRNYKFPGKQLRSPLRIRGDKHIRPSSSDTPQGR